MSSFQVEEIVLHHLRLPLAHPFQTSFQRETVKDTIVVEVRSDAGSGWGEAPVHAAPKFSGESIESVWVTARDWLAPPLVGRSFDCSGTAYELGELWPKIRGNQIARSGLESALWCLRAQVRGESLAQAYSPPEGEPPAETIGVGVSIGIQPDLKSLVARVKEQVEAGYQRVKVKIQPEWDVEPMERLRKEFPKLLLAADANGAYQPDELELLRPLDPLHLLFLEQPLPPDRLAAHAKWQAQLHTSICLDESLDSPGRVEEAIEAEACRMVNIKLGRIGGTTAALAARDLCREADWPCWVGGMLESGVGRLHNVALAATAGFTHPGDISASKRYVEHDIIVSEVTVSKDGEITVPTAPGLGAKVNAKLLKKYCVRALRVR
ncbi:MAG: o-succinylbenzoate synthase [Planctomycetota bacterium]